MDIFKLLKSLEEVLFEAIVLLVFYPRTLWLSLRYPQRMMDYADTELGDVTSDQYNDTVSPPIFLMLSVGLVYIVGITFQHDDLSAAETSSLLADPQQLLIFRVFAFSLLPLFMSLKLLSDLGEPLNRDTLRPPFFSQCFATAPYVLGFSFGLQLVAGAGSWGVWPGAGLILASSAWYVRQQAHWFASKRQSSLLKGWITAPAVFVGGWVVILAILYAVTAVQP